jgi:hypothetical protein
VIPVVVLTYLVLGSLEVEYALARDIFHTIGKFTGIGGVDSNMNARRNGNNRVIPVEGEEGRCIRGGSGRYCCTIIRPRGYSGPIYLADTRKTIGGTFP